MWLEVSMHVAPLKQRRLFKVWAQLSALNDWVIKVPTTYCQSIRLNCCYEQVVAELSIMRLTNALWSVLWSISSPLDQEKKKKKRCVCLGRNFLHSHRFIFMCKTKLYWCPGISITREIEMLSMIMVIISCHRSPTTHMHPIRVSFLLCAGLAMTQFAMKRVKSCK